jgi:tRNA-uridine 2-sulfurtransferase
MKKKSSKKIVFAGMSRRRQGFGGRSRRRGTVFVGMSGGVDSSVAALLLKRRGYDVVGVFMKCWTGDAPFDKLRVNCAWQRDSEDARRGAEHIGIPFYVWDFEKEYKRKVVEYMVSGYRKGLTPNPDVMCNREIKFGLFLEKALALGADYVATGHYVRLRRVRNPKLRIPARPAGGHPNDPNIRGIRIHSDFSDRFEMYQAKDTNKDQSYFLWTLTQRQLKHCLFPIGDYVKPKVREIARKAGLPTADKKDSQGICFLGNISISDFLKTYIPTKRGNVLLAPSGVEGSTTYRKIGEHEGAYFYTIGQRHGLDLGTKNKELRIKGSVETKPHYVSAKDVHSNTITVAEGEDNPALYRKEVNLTDVNLIRPLNETLHASRSKFQVFARVRYRQPLSRAQLLFSNSRACPPKLRRRRELENKKQRTKSSVKLVFDAPQRFIAPGQSAVFYSRSGEMLGGGVIMGSR